MPARTFCADPGIIGTAVRGPPAARCGTAHVTEGDGVQADACEVRISAPMTNDLVVAVASLDTSEVTVTNAVTIPAGQTNAQFV